MKFIYTLSYATKTRTIEPTTIGKIVLAREDGEVFFREKMTGGLELKGDDFTFLQEADKYKLQCCQAVDLIISTQCGNEMPVLFWQGYFTLMEISFNVSLKSAIISKVSTRDAYTPVFACYNREINMLEGAQEQRPGQSVPNKQTLTPFRFPFAKTEEYNPKGSDTIGQARNFNLSLQTLIQRTLVGTGYEKYGVASPEQFSTFLNADINPVTGNSNYLKQVSIVHLSAAKRPGATNFATKGIMTLKSVLDDLKKLYNCYWYIDENERIRLEHYSFFNHLSYESPAVTLDLTDKKFADAMFGNLRYSYQIDQLKGIEGVELALSQSAMDSTSELFSILPASMDEFESAYIVYNDSCVPKDDKGEKTSEIVTITNFTCSWAAITLRPDVLPDEGWALVHTVIDGTANNVPKTKLPISNISTENGCMSATALYFNFGRYNNSFLYGIVSSQKEKPPVVSGEAGRVVMERPLRSRSTKKIKTFPDVELPLCCGDMYDFTGYIKHPLDDNCVIQQLEYNLITQTVTATITAGDSCADSPFPDYNESDSPPTGCSPAGSLIRVEESSEYLYENAIGTYYLITFKSVYASGNCDEYFSTKQEKRVIPKRGNGPR